MFAALALATQIPAVRIPEGSVGAAPVRAELRLSVDRPVVGRGENPGYRLTIRNLGRTPLSLSDLQSGSAIGAVNPSADWVTPDLRNGDFLFGCGDHERVEASRFFTLAPGESRELDASAIGRAPLSPGVNRVSLTYAIEAKRSDVSVFGTGRPLGGTPAERAGADAQSHAILDRYKALTPVRLTSNVVRVTVRVTP